MVFLKKKKSKRKVNFGIVSIILVFFMILVFGGYAALNSKIFNSENIIINGNNVVSEEIILNLSGISSDKNIFRYKLKDVEKSVLENPYVKNILIKRKLPNTLIVEVVEKEIGAVLKSGEKYCYIDREGNLIETIENIKDKNLNYITLEADYNIEKNNILEYKNREYLKRIPYLLDCINKENLHKSFIKIDMKNEDIISLYNKDNIKFTLENKNDLEYDISRVVEILVDLQSKRVNGGEVDLTHKNYAIFKP